MSPKTGRPPKGAESRKINLNIRVSTSESELIKECAERLETTRTDVIVKGVSLVKAELDKKK